MKQTYPYYKIVISYFNIASDGSSNTESVLIFQEAKPIESRKKAIERFRSLEEIFEQGIKDGNLLKSITHLFDTEIKELSIPSLNLYFCENESADDDLVLYGTLLESFDERILELTDECEYYYNNNIENEGFEIIREANGEMHTILKDSLLKDGDVSKSK